MNNLVALEPKKFDSYITAIEESGGVVAELGKEVEALVWTDYSQPELLAKILSDNPQLRWVQLPFAGVDAFAEVIRRFHVRFTSAKGAFSEPVAEHALALALALGRAIPERSRAQTWGKKFAVSLFDSQVLIIGAGGITEKLLEMLEPFRADVTILRNRPELSSGATTIASADLLSALPGKDFIFINCALTDETRGMFGQAAFEQMDSTAFLVNVARGGVVNTQDLVAALGDKQFAGYATDVTDPEPLPDGHPLWALENVLITPHSADTKQMVLPLFSKRLAENVSAFLGKGEFVGVVDPLLGY
jgi:phosphoglycerate dehydrogenase-like enzyme